jgi:O-antigen/teichoic acid export membrane protein
MQVRLRVTRAIPGAAWQKRSQEDGTVPGASAVEPPASEVRSAGSGGQGSPRARKLIAWAMKGGLAMMDQGLISGSNFVIGVLLARWMAPDQYGAYAVAFAAFLLLVMLYQSWLLEPMAVFGSSVYRDSIRGYLKTLLRIHFATAVFIFLALCVAAEVAYLLKQPGGLPGALFGVALTAPCVFLFWLARRTFYLELSPAPAVVGALCYCALTLGGLYVAFRLHRLSPMSAMLLMGFGGLGTSAVLFTYLKLRLPLGRITPDLGETWRRHWGYGRWALASAAVMWIPANIFYPILSSFSGLAQAGELKALSNVGAPMLQIYAALSSLLLPYAARVQAREGTAGAPAVVRRISLLCVSGALVYWTLLLLFRGPIFQFLYSGKYTEVAYLLPVAAVGSVAGSAFFGPATVLRAMHSPASVFGAALGSSCVALLIGVPATKFLGIKGAVWSMALADSLTFVIALVLLRRKVRSAANTASAILPELSVSK